MPYTLKPNKIYARDNDGNSYLPQNVITDRTTAEDIELWRTATADIKADANAAVSQARTDVDQIAAAVASMVDLGTDTSLSTSRMAADAKATGDAVGDLKSAFTNDSLKVNSEADAIANNVYESNVIDSSDIIGVANGCIFTTEVGETITFGTESNLRHCYVNVNPGETYKITIRKWETTKRYHIAFTDSNDKVLLLYEKGNGSSTTTTNIVTVPNGASKMYAFAKTSQVQNIYFEIQKMTIEFLEKNNIASSLVAGYWSNSSMSGTSGATQKFESIKNTLSSGVYTLTFGVDVDIIRIIIGSMYCDQTRSVSAGQPFTFYVPFDGDVGFSFVDNTGGSPQTWTSWVQLEQVENTNGKHANTAIDVKAREDFKRITNAIAETTISNKDLINGWYDGATYRKAMKRATSFNRWKVKKGDIAYLLNKDIAVSFVYFDNEFNYLTTTNIVSYRYIADVHHEALIYEFDQDGYITFNMYNRANGTEADVVLNDYQDIIVLSHPSTTFSLNVYRETAKKVKVKPFRYSNVSINGQGGCVIGDNLWSFGDGSNVDGSIKIIDLRTMQVAGTKSHRLGHANSVDYCKQTSTMLLYGSNGTNQPTLVLYRYPELVESLNLTDENCIVLPLYKSGSFMNVSGSACFGESRNIVYFIDGIYENDTPLITVERNIYKILLGMGDNDLSSEGYGTFISGKGGAEYNGTCKVIETYTGDIIPGIHCFANANSLWTPQDMKYNGYLYVSYGTAGINNLKIVLDDDSKTYTVVNNYYVDHYGYDGSIVKFEPEMIAFYDHKMYCGANDRSTHENSLFEVELPY